MLHVRAAIYTCSYASILKSKITLLESNAPPSLPDGHTPNTSQSPSSTPAMNERGGGGGEVGSYRLGYKGSVSAGSFVLRVRH